MPNPDDGRADRIREVIRMLELALADCHRLLAAEEGDDGAGNDNQRLLDWPDRRPD